jgi:hypothetical protein
MDTIYLFVHIGLCYVDSTLQSIYYVDLDYDL